LTAENIERVWLEVTNDGNESELGIFRETQKSAPNESHEYHNALRMYEAKLTSNYLKSLDTITRMAIHAQG
jgi:hypothetical protein